ncbi:MAG: DUF4912 domain-containing protein [Clostridia bacterium]|nr:DUF4912 domain-containing protein [Clostridia bacterium]
MFTLITGLVLAFLVIGIFFWYRQQIAPPAARPLPETTPLPQDVPATYGKDEIVLMVKDPYWLYAYWELTDAKKEEIRNRFGWSAWENSRPMLRVYELTNHPYDFLHAPFFEIAITNEANNWYIHTNKPNSTFCVDLGCWIPDYGFITLVRSNIVTTPADRPSDIIDPLWPPIEACWYAVQKFDPSSSVSSPDWHISSAHLVGTQK